MTVFILVRTIVEKVDGNASLINLDQSKAFDRVDHTFLEAVLYYSRFRVALSHLDPSPLCIPWSHGRGEWSKVRAFHFDSTDLSRLPAIAYALNSCG